VLDYQEKLFRNHFYQKPSFKELIVNNDEKIEKTFLAKYHTKKQKEVHLTLANINILVE